MLTEGLGSSWQWTTLEEACSLITDGTHYSPPSSAGQYSFLTVKDMHDGWLDFDGCSRINEEEYIRASQAAACPIPGDVLFSKDGTVGKVHLVIEKTPFAVLSSVAILRPFPHLLDSRYLSFALRNPSTLRDAANRKTGTALKRIILEDLKKIAVPLPPLDEQRRIATILSRADRVRRLARYSLDLGGGYLQAIFLEMFGDPVKNPKEWRQVELGKLISFITSGSRGWAEHYSETGARFIRVQNLRGHRLNLDDVAYVTPPNSPETERARIHPHDLLLAITGATIGLSALAPEDIGEAYVNQHVAILRLNETAEAVYIAAFMSHNRGGQYQIAEMQYGDTKPGLNLEQIRSMTIPLPSIDLQRQFTAVAHQYERIWLQQQEHLRQAEHLFASLLNWTFRNELNEQEISSEDFMTGSIPIEQPSSLTFEQMFGISVRQGALLRLITEMADVNPRGFVTRTPIAKVALLVTREDPEFAPPVAWYSHKPDDYGAFDEKILFDLDALETAGLIQQRRHEDFNRIDTFPIEEKYDLIQRVTSELPESMRERIDMIAKKYGHLTYRQIVKLTYKRYPDLAQFTKVEGWEDWDT